MFKNVRTYFKTKHQYHASMMELSGSVTEKLKELFEAELARTKAETDAMEAVKQMNLAFSTEEMSGYMEQLSEFLTEMKQPKFQESFYQNMIDSAREKDAVPGDGAVH